MYEGNSRLTQQKTCVYVLVRNSQPIGSAWKHAPQSRVFSLQSSDHIMLKNVCVPAGGTFHTLHQPSTILCYAILIVFSCFSFTLPSSAPAIDSAWFPRIKVVDLGDLEWCDRFERQQLKHLESFAYILIHIQAATSSSYLPLCKNKKCIFELKAIPPGIM